MAKILEFKRPSPKKIHQGKTLCREGFHKWVVVTDSKFDIKKGKLVTVYECERCGKQKVTTN